MSIIRPAGSEDFPRPLHKAKIKMLSRSLRRRRLSSNSTFYQLVDAFSDRLLPRYKVHLSHDRNSTSNRAMFQTQSRRREQLCSKIENQIRVLLITDTTYTC